jgi:DNA-binding CsgD family transcriptional regulator
MTERRKPPKARGTGGPRNGHHRTAAAFDDARVAGGDVSRRTRVVPRELEALATDDEDFVVLSFPLPRDGRETLSPAESEVASLLMAGRTNAEIAALRGTSLRTTANQVASLFRKLGVRSRLQLVTSAPLVDARTERCRTT